MNGQIELCFCFFWTMRIFIGGLRRLRQIARAWSAANGTSADSKLAR